MDNFLILKPQGDDLQVPHCSFIGGQSLKLLNLSRRHFANDREVKLDVDNNDVETNDDNDSDDDNSNDNAM